MTVSVQEPREPARRVPWVVAALGTACFTTTVSPFCSLTQDLAWNLLQDGVVLRPPHPVSRYLQETWALGTHINGWVSSDFSVFLVERGRRALGPG